jgi:hypothetical protein
VKHHASAAFWSSYNALPQETRLLADKTFALLKENPRHPSLRFKKIGEYWSARVGIHYRALAVEATDGVVWFWIGSHADYDKILS